MLLVQWNSSRQTWMPSLCLWSIFRVCETGCFFCSMGRQNAQLAITHGLQQAMLSRTWWECWLCIWLFPWWSKWQKAALGSPTVSRHGVCLLHLLVVFFFFPPACSVMYSSQPFKVKCHLGCESCLSVGWDSRFHWDSLGRRSTATEQQSWDVAFWKVLNSGLMWKHDKSLVLTCRPGTTLSAGRRHLRTVGSTGFMREWQRWVEQRSWYSTAVVSAQTRGSVTGS